MNPLEQRLRSLPVEWPEEPDLAPAVSLRLEEPERRPRRRRWPVAVALAAAALAAAFAVPQSRSAILQFLGLEGVTVTRVQRLPSVGRGPLATGEKVTLAQAEKLLGFRPLLPAGPPPAGVYADRNFNVLTLLYGAPQVRLRVFELPIGSPVVKKLLSVEQPVIPLRINGHPGFFVEGKHVVSGFLGEARISGSALVFQTTGLTIRLEGRFTRAQAVEIANSFR